MIVVVVCCCCIVPELVKKTSWRGRIGFRRCARGWIDWGWIDGRGGTTWRTVAQGRLRRRGRGEVGGGGGGRGEFRRRGVEEGGGEVSG